MDLGREIFWQFQKDLILCPAQDIVVQWARGNGKTFAIAAKIAIATFQAEAEGRSEDWLIASATRDQAKEAIDKVAAWCRVFLLFGKTIGVLEEEIRTPDGKEIFTRWMIRIGSQRIMAQAASPNAARGYTANIWWDEAAHYPDGAEMYEALQHCTRGHYKMIVSGTPWGGRDNQFYKLVHNDETHEGKPLWWKSIIDIHEAVRQGRKYNIERGEKKSTPDLWAREMLLQWIEGAQQWFESKLLDRCESEQCSIDGSAAKFGKGAAFFVGNDIGLRGHLWVAWVLQKIGDQLFTVEVVPLRGSTFKQQDAVIDRLMKTYRPIRLSMDQGGMGEGSAEKYIDKYGSTIEPVLFNPNNKGEMAYRTKREFQAEKLFIPAHQFEIRADLRKLQKIISTSGNVRFDADGSDGNHADYYTALALATSAAIDCPNAGGFKASGTRQKQRGEEYAGY
jgi:phage FluMu gp28-like protein